MTANLTFPTLSLVRLPEDAPILRDYPLPAEKRNAVYEASFDRRTLIYDAFVDLEKNVTTLICPRLINLKKLLRTGLRSDAGPVRIKRHRKALRFERIDLHGTAPIWLEIDGIDRLDIPLTPIDDTQFNALNMAVTCVKNEDPDWIINWAKYHVNAHDLQGLILIDNGTTQFDMHNVGERLSQETGLQKVAVVAADVPYGGAAGGRLVIPSKFFQVSMLQITRWRFLRQARAVVHLDIDEMVAPFADGKSVFDHTCGARFGCLKILGQWTYPENNGAAQPQADHLYHHSPAKSANPKWGITPGSLADRFDWVVHRPAGPLFPLLQNHAVFWHCFATSRGWKKTRDTNPANLIRDDLIAKAYARHLPK